jgi:hypothetical protein
MLYIVCRHDRRGDASFASLGVSSHPVRHCRSASCAWVANPSARCLGPTSVGVSLDIAASGRRPIDASRRSLGFCSRRMAHLSTHVLRSPSGPLNGLIVVWIHCGISTAYRRLRLCVASTAGPHASAESVLHIAERYAPRDGMPLGLGPRGSYR